MKSQPDIPTLTTLRLTVNTASMIVTGIGIAVIIGWIFDVPFLKSIIPNAATMKFNTALCFSLAGFSLWLLKNEESGTRNQRFGRLLAGFVVAISAITVIEYLFDWQLGVDQLFVQDPAASAGAYPGRMSGITAVCFIFIGLALQLINRRNSQFFSISVMLLSLLGVIGYLFDYQALYRLGGYGTVAFHTGFTFLILSFAVLAARPTLGVMRITTSNLEGGRAARLLLPFTTLFVILLGWLIDQGRRLGFFDAENSAVILTVLLVVIYSPLIFFYARKINKSEELINHLNRLYATLSHVNQAVVHSKDRQTLFQAICNAVVTVGKFRLSRIGILDEEPRYVNIVAVNDAIMDREPPLRIDLSKPAFDEGLIGSALQGQKIITSDDIRTDERMKHWYDDSLKYDYHSAASIPLHCRSKIVGVLILYAAEAGFFQEDGELRLLEEISLDISFALDSMEQEVERRQAEEALRKSEERFVKAFHASPVGLVITRLTDATYLDANDSYLQMFEFSRDELIGHTPIELNIIAAEERERLAQHVREHGKLSNFEIQSRTKTGKLITTLLSTEQIELGDEVCNIAMTFDISERKRSEAKIQRHLEQLTGLQRIDRAISSSFDIRTTLEIVLQEVASQLGVDAVAILLINAQDQSMEYTASRGFRSNILDSIKLELGESYASRALRERRTIHIPDLSIVAGNLSGAIQFSAEGFVDYYGTPLIAKERIEGALEIYNRSPLNAGTEWIDLLNTLAGQAAIAIDNARLWERIQLHTSELERRVEERTAQLNQTNLELEHANRAKDDFLAAMSHELRTPLNSILGLSEALMEQRRDPLSEYQLHSLQIIESSGRHLLELINDILDISKIEAGMFDYYPQIVDADQLCRASLVFVKEQALRKSINLIYEEGRFIFKVHVDPRRVKQILVNLLINAIKFTSERGQVTLQVEGDSEHDLVRFTVSDNGIGIAPNDLRRLFQPFVQVDSSLNRRFEGTGLGLALVQKLTELHGGSVSVESRVGEGSRFTITLPCGKEIVESRDRLSTADVSEKTGPILDGPINRRTILLAEDNNANVVTISEYLESHGYEITVAHDGLEALELAEEIHPDIILMDIQMPVLDGLEAIRRLRANSRFKPTPIIALTALAMPGDRELCLEAGANEYITKPVSLKFLAKKIREMLEREV